MSISWDKYELNIKTWYAACKSYLMFDKMTRFWPETLAVRQKKISNVYDVVENAYFGSLFHPYFLYLKSHNPFNPSKHYFCIIELFTVPFHTNTYTSYSSYCPVTRNVGFWSLIATYTSVDTVNTSKINLHLNSLV